MPCLLCSAAPCLPTGMGLMKTATDERWKGNKLKEEEMEALIGHATRSSASRNAEAAADTISCEAATGAALGRYGYESGGGILHSSPLK